MLAAGKMKLFTLTPVFLFVIACSTQVPVKHGLPTAEERQVLELSDFFQSGHERFSQALSNDSLLSQVWYKHRDKVVLILIEIQYEDGEREQAQQSGIMIGEKRTVLTAGHGFYLNDGMIISIRLIGPGGQETPLHLLDSEYTPEADPVHDWALLQPLTALEAATFLSPMKRSRFSSRIIIMGFPGGLGLNREEVVIHVAENKSEWSTPLGIIAERRRLDPYTLLPLAGSIPVQGISGSPVFNSQGDLIGIFSTLGRRRSATGWHYVFGLSELPRERIKGLTTN